jgi:hypothetical protein
MSDPGNMLLFVGDDDYEHYNDARTLLGAKAFLSERNVCQESKLYRIKFDSEKIDESTLRRFRTASFDFEQPPLNDYIPEKLELKTLCASTYFFTKEEEVFLSNTLHLIRTSVRRRS